MTAKRDYYEILGVSKNADEKVIKKVYRKLAKKYHPDTNAGNAQAEKRFKEVTEAYTILSDSEKRKLYDQFGHAAFEGNAEEFYRQAAKSGTRNGMGGGNFYGGTAGPNFHGNAGDSGFNYYTNNDGSYREYHFTGDHADDIFGNIFGDFFGNRQEGGFGQSRSGNGYYNGGSGSKNYGRGFGGNHYNGGFGSGNYGRGFDSSHEAQSNDLHAEIAITFEDAAFGCDKIIQLQKDTGEISSLQVHIPAGIEDGKSIRLRGKGAMGRNGGQRGDLLLKVNVGAKPGFERKGQDIYTVIRIPFVTAVLGGEVQVETIYGKVLCKIQAGTQSGTKIRLKGKGIVSMKDSSVYGDQYATVQIEVPRNLNAEAIRKLREFSREMSAA